MNNKPVSAYATFLDMMARTFAIHSNDICGKAQDCSNPIANALELLQSCTKPSIWSRLSYILCIWIPQSRKFWI